MFIDYESSVLTLSQWTSVLSTKIMILMSDLMKTFAWQWLTILLLFILMWQETHCDELNHEYFDFKETEPLHSIFI